MNLKRRIPAIMMAAGLALAGAACDAEVDGDAPGQTEPAVPGEEGVGDGIGGGEDTAP